MAQSLTHPPRYWDFGPHADPVEQAKEVNLKEKAYTELMSAERIFRFEEKGLMPAAHDAAVAP